MCEVPFSSKNRIHIKIPIHERAIHGRHVMTPIIYIYIYICIYACVVYTYTYIYIYIYIYICVCVCKCVCVCIHMSCPFPTKFTTRFHPHERTRKIQRRDSHVRINICIYICIHVCVCAAFFPPTTSTQQKFAFTKEHENVKAPIIYIYVYICIGTCMYMSCLFPAKYTYTIKIHIHEKSTKT